MTTEVSCSYSQCGEDLIVHNLFAQAGTHQPSYLDIGAYDPLHFSNTALLHQLGSTGINVEPHPDRIALFHRERPDDVNLAVGVAAVSGELTYYDFGEEKNIVNTFSAEEAHKSKCRGHHLARELTVPVLTLEQIITQYWGSRFPDFLSIDAEGLDAEILESMTAMDISLRPQVICVETLGYTAQRGQGINLAPHMMSILAPDGYTLYAQTRLNGIFVRHEEHDIVAETPGSKQNSKRLQL